MISTLPRMVRYVANIEKLNIPVTLAWLTERELAELSHWKDASRRTQWLAGRWVAKRLVTRSSCTERMREVEILSRGDDGLGKSPRVSVSGTLSDYRLSISHCQQALLVGITQRDAQIGVDVATGVPSSANFRTRWFSDYELKWINSDAQHRLPIAWALKEAVFKACGNGSKWNPRSVELVTIERDRVLGRIDGASTSPFQTWIRVTRGGAAAAVWSKTALQEVSLCS